MTKMITVLSIYIDGEVTASLHKTPAAAYDTLRQVFDHMPYAQERTVMDDDDLVDHIVGLYEAGTVAVAVEELRVP